MATDAIVSQFALVSPLSATPDGRVSQFALVSPLSATPDARLSQFALVSAIRVLSGVSLVPFGSGFAKGRASGLNASRGRAEGL